MNDTTEVPTADGPTAELPEGTAVFGVTDDQPIGQREPDPTPDAARPRVRIGAVVWGLVVSVFAALMISVVLDPVRSAEIATWLGQVSGATIGLIALISLGALLLLLGLVSLLRHAQRRGERA